MNNRKTISKKDDKSERHNYQTQCISYSLSFSLLCHFCLVSCVKDKSNNSQRDKMEKQYPRSQTHLSVCPLIWIERKNSHRYRCRGYLRAKLGNLSNLREWQDIKQGVQATLPGLLVRRETREPGNSSAVRDTVTKVMRSTHYFEQKFFVITVDAVSEARSCLTQEEKSLLDSP